MHAFLVRPKYIIRIHVCVRSIPSYIHLLKLKLKLIALLLLP